MLPVIAEVSCRELSRADFQEIIDQARTRSVAEHLHACLSALVAAGIEEGHLLDSRDLLRGVRWHGEFADDAEPVDHAVTWEELPSVELLHALARRAAERAGLWWRELQLLLVAYSGMRWGEHVGLTYDQMDPSRRQVRIDRQIVEASGQLLSSLPKGRRRRTTMYPVETPLGVDLGALTFVVDDVLDRLRAHGAELVGEVAQYEDI